MRNGARTLGKMLSLSPLASRTARMPMTGGDLRRNKAAFEIL